MIGFDDLIAELVLLGAGSWETVEREMTLPRYAAIRCAYDRLRGVAPARRGDFNALLALAGAGGVIR